MVWKKNGDNTASCYLESGGHSRVDSRTQISCLPSQYTILSYYSLLILVSFYLYGLSMKTNATVNAHLLNSQQSQLSELRSHGIQWSGPLVKMHGLENCLPHILSGVFANVSKDLDWRSSWITQMGPKSNDKCSYKRGRQREQKTMKKWKQRLGLHSHKPGNVWSHQKTEEAKKSFSLRAPEGTQPCGHLDFRRLSLRTLREYTPVVLSHAVWANLLWQPQQTSGMGESHNHNIKQQQKNTQYGEKMILKSSSNNTKTGTLIILKYYILIKT